MKVGYRFHPTEEEIINHYLKLKRNGYDFDDIIVEIDLYHFDPSEIPALTRMPDEHVWYFICYLAYKHGNKKRTTRTGFWKETSRVRHIWGSNGKEIGTMRTLVFRRKGHDSKHTKTNWVIHEYQAKEQDRFVICKLKNKDESNESTDNFYEEGEPSHAMGIVGDNRLVQATIPEVRRDNDINHLTSLQPRQEQIFSGGDFLPNDDPNGSRFQFDWDELADSFLVTPDEYYSNETALAKGLGGDDINHPTSLQPRTQEQISSDTDFLPNNDPNGFIFQFDSDEEELYPAAFANSFPVTPDECDRVKMSGRAEYLQPVPDTFIAPGPMYELQMNSSPVEPKTPEILRAPLPLHQKGRMHVASEKGRKMAQVMNAKPELKLRSNESSGNNRLGPFIRLETSPSSHIASPPAVYLVNVIVGLILFLIIIKEMMVLH